MKLPPAPPAHPRRLPLSWLLAGLIPILPGLANRLDAQTGIMPMGDSITAGGGAGQAGPGYRGRLYDDLVGANVSFSYLGINNNANGPTTGLTSLPDAYIYHNGYGSYTLADINSNLAANGSAHTTPNQGGFWITGGNPTSNSNGAVNRPAVFPDVLLLMGGTNDADYSNGTNLAAMETNLDNILKWFNTNRPNTLVIVGTAVPWNKYGDADAPATAQQVAAYNAWLINTEIPKFPKYRVANINPLFLNPDGSNNTGLFTGTSDGIHPNSAGYTIMADAWYAALQAVGIIPKWRGDGASNVWSAGGTANFVRLTGSTTSSVPFTSGDAVYFGDDGSNSPAVSLGGTLTPASVTVTASQPYTFAGSGLLSGTMTLIKNGAGTLQVATANTFTGDTTINGGTLQIGAGGTSGALGTSNVNVVNKAALAFNRTDAATFPNVVTGPGTVRQLGTGTTVLTGTNTYSGVTTISAGALQIGNNATTGTLGTGPVVNNASLVFNRSDNVTLYNAVSGPGALTKLGAGVLAVGTAQSYTGPTVISGGTLRLQNAPPLFTTGLLYQLSAANPNGYAVNGTGNVTQFNDLSGNGNHFTATGTNGPTVLTGSDGVNGLNVLHFSGASTSSKLGQVKTTTAKSVFIVNRPAPTALTGGNYGQNGGVLNGIWGRNNADLGVRLSATTANAWQYANGDVSDFASATSGSMWINGVAVATSAQGSFSTGGAHLLEFANANAATFAASLGSYFTNSNRAFVGDIAEVLAYSAVLSTTDRQAVEAYMNYRWFTPAGGFTVLSPSTAVSLTLSGAAMDLNGLSQPVASLTGVTGSRVFLGGGTLTVNNASATTFAGSINDAGGNSSATGGGLVKNGPGTLTLSGSNTYSGPTLLTGGTLAVSGQLVTTGATITVGNGATLNVNGGTVTAGSILVLSGGTLTGTGTVNANVTNAGTITSGAGQTLTFNGNVTNNGLLLFTGGSAFTVPNGTVTNNGTLDIITGSQTLPAGLVNNGSIRDASANRVTSFVAAGGNATLTVQSYAGHDYQLQSRPDLVSGAWQDVGNPMAGNNQVLSLSNSVATPADQGFYRVRISP